MDFLKIDGSFGEGGGQIIRSAVTLSCITQTPIKIENIRKNRKVPGLRPQHLTGIKLLSKVCNAKVNGLEIGSTSISFDPQFVQDSQLIEDIKTAGSISLILQVLIPAVSISKKSLKLSITGGTDVPWSPTSDYTRFVLSEAYSRMGIKFSVKIKKRGYYPRGGGVIDLNVFPSKKINPITLLKRKFKQVKLYCSFSKLPSDKIKEYVKVSREFLEGKKFTVTTEINEQSGMDEGGSMLVFSQDSDSIVGVDCLYDKKTKRFEKNVSQELYENNLGVDNHLSDMLIVPAAVADDTSIFRVQKITKHLETNLYVTSKITGCKYGIGKLDNGFEVRISGKSDSSVH